MRAVSTDTSIALAQKSLDALWLRQQAISDNIANKDTPGYKSKSVAFENLLRKAVDAGGSESGLEERILSVKPELQEDSAAMGEDGNGVDADAESISLVQTQLQYQAMVQAVSAEFSRMSYVLNGGK
ncbi:MAG: flagellar basal body rod protein FlgB [Clostridiaceae bacterium]|nr:flagellar basal body rod protein FlgB [Clostridiaceae bacterium]